MNMYVPVIMTMYDDDVVLLPPRAPSAYPILTVVPGAASGLHDVLLLLLLLLLQQLIRCSGAATMHVRLLSCSAAAAPAAAVLLFLGYVVAANPYEHGKYASQFLSVMYFCIKEKYGPTCFGSCTCTVLQWTLFWCLGGCLVPA